MCLELNSHLNGMTIFHVLKYKYQSQFPSTKLNQNLMHKQHQVPYFMICSYIKFNHHIFSDLLYV